MKFVFIHLSFILMSFTLFSQKNICGDIAYTETFTNNSQFEYNLYFNKNKSVYVQNNSKNDSIIQVSGFMLPSITYIYQYNRSDENFIFQSDVAFENVVANDPLTDLKWAVGKETKKIGKYTCIKATLIFRGVNYIAWFTPEIPAKYGPWKFRDLQGLILEVYDENNNYKIVATHIKIYEECNAINKKIASNTLKNPISWQEYVALIKAESDQIESVLNSKLGRNEGSVGVDIEQGFQREIIK